MISGCSSDTHVKTSMSCICGRYLPSRGATLGKQEPEMLGKNCVGLAHQAQSTTPGTALLLRGKFR